MKNGGKQAQSMRGKTKGKRDDLADEIDALFKLQLGEFTGARNTLAAQLKKSRCGEDAIRVKALGKPSITAWAVNQLYWNHRDVFDQLIASGERFHKAQTARPAGKVADMRTALDARREALTELSDLATSLLRDAGHNPSPDTIRRVTTTLEGLSAYASRSDAPRAGRLTDDVDPPGFESFAGFVPGMSSVPAKQTYPPATAGGTNPTTTNTRSAEARKTKLAAAKASLQDAKRSLTAARARAQSLEAAQKKADAEATRAEKHRRDLEVSLEKAKDAAEAATLRKRKVAVEVEDAAQELQDAERTVETATKELEKY